MMLYKEANDAVERGKRCWRGNRFCSHSGWFTANLNLLISIGSDMVRLAVCVRVSLPPPHTPHPTHDPTHDMVTVRTFRILTVCGVYLSMGCEASQFYPSEVVSHSKAPIFQPFTPKHL